MGAVKEAMMECLDAGVVPVNPESVGLWAEQLGDRADILAGMPMQHRINGRLGPVDVDVIPITVAFRIGQILPETHDELGWMLDVFVEARL